MTLFPTLEKYIINLSTATLTQERKAILNEIAQYILQKQAQNETVNLNFICTHNSRRSQLAQLWAQTMAYQAGIQLNSFSGGVEVTAFHPNAVKTLEKAGFKISNNPSNNPLYLVSFSKNHAPVTAFSKMYDHPNNPSANFAAIMTCSEADDNCPFIPGADVRIPLRYTDPKRHDGTDNEANGYENTSKEIASEMKFLFNSIQKNK